MKVLKYNLILFFFIPFQGFSQYALISSNTFSNLLVEVATSNKQKKDGLMFVEQLETNGLLLHYKAPKIVNIWMKNTLIPLRHNIYKMKIWKLFQLKKEPFF